MYQLKIFGGHLKWDTLPTDNFFKMTFNLNF